MTDSLLQTAIDAADVGAEILMQYFHNGVQMRDKSGAGGKAYDLVSDADLDSEKAIAEFLLQRFPDHELLGEEDLKGDIGGEHLWIIDPLDGTSNFAHRVPYFAVSIAYYHRGQPTVGVVLNPVSGERFTAERGHGAHRNGIPVSVCQDRSLGEALIGCGIYYDRGPMVTSTLAAIDELFANDIHGIRRFGAAALDLCKVGCGQLGGFFEYYLSPWDFAAGGLFVQEAGGQISSAKGQPLAIEPSSVAASNGHLHGAIIDIAARHHP